MALVSVPPGFQPMRSILLALIAALCALSVSAAEQDRAPKDMVLLTVSGTIGESNRGPLDPKKDSLLALNKIEFNKAFAFDRAYAACARAGHRDGAAAGVRQACDLQGAAAPRGARPYRGGEAEGHRRRDQRLSRAGLAPEDIDRSDWILALEADGVPLGIGQQGPLWLINTRGRRREARRGWTRPLGLCRVLYAGRRVRGMT